jgi:predicted methyltransferase
VFDSLKPGGLHFIIDHAAAAGTGATLSRKLRRIDKATVIAEVTGAGFRLAGESEVLRNRADDHARNVFDPAIHFKTDQS